ncbi:nuclear transport factor 2 family protein [Novosphingobium sp. G106]|uniref:nuclear transport factor 2 family protein n=1 Tax=Novosphingobium sp. G106 TaxID=2849500 RepID=UPI001C2DC422|nr:nuclear transport factor 2 family protein [Novosphingobium sp. G106]MBV1687553.1 nuclear transport factor 2 family protein [Novosphingobium sp. G106]
MSDIAAMLARFETQQDHIDLMNRYAHALDVRDWGLLASLFTVDAAFRARVILEGGVPDADNTAVDGRDALVATLQAIWDGLSATHHMLSNHVVEPAADGTSAKASCYLRAHHVGNRERAHLFEESLGRFDFETVRTDGGWKIRHMEENLFVMLGTAEAFAPPPN